ncbi:MAG: hypothetical protein QX199_15655 [Methylococcaceae bacterium]
MNTGFHDYKREAFQAGQDFVIPVLTFLRYGYISSTKSRKHSNTFRWGNRECRARLLRGLKHTAAYLILLTRAACPSPIKNLSNRTTDPVRNLKFPANQARYYQAHQSIAVHPASIAPANDRELADFGLTPSDDETAKLIDVIGHIAGNSKQVPLSRYLLTEASVGLV